MDMIKPEHVARIPMLSDQQKTHYRDGLTKLWAAMDAHPKDSEQHQQAVSKIKQVSRELMRQVSNWNKTGGNPAQRPNSQGQQQQRPNPQQTQPASQAQAPQQQQQQQQQQPQQSQPQQQQAQPPAQQQQQQSGGPQQGQQAQQAQIQLSAGAKNYLQNFKIFPPANIQPNTPEFENYKARTLRMLSQAIMAQESSVSRYQSFNEKITQLESSGQDVPPELSQAREQAKNMVQGAKAKGDAMRADNDKNKAYWLAKTKANGAAAPPSNGDSGSPHPNSVQNQMQNQNQNQVPGQAQLQQQQHQQTQQQMRQPQSQPQMNNGAPMYAANPALDNAQNQAARPSMSPAMSTPFQGQNQSTAGMHAGQPGGQMPQQQQQQQQQGQQPPNSAAPRPAPMPQQHPFQSPSTQAGGTVQPLTHQAAINQANRSYSQQHSTQQQVTPTTADGTPFSQMPNQNPMSVNQKFPVPKQLVVPPVTPVPMGPARPTFGGPSNGAPGMMGQPALAKHPGFILEGEGDRVLSKKKLDELVRQVTGGGEGDGLTPDVEEAVLTLADDFVDNVITAACRLAKIRSNSTLDIRDIQIILERNYNIRVPGYSLDEIRTVRKFQPAQGWTQKMNAVQAAKVMGKNDT
ncbi:hypothetical protein MBLNU459_g1474t1 [Dothideomycetes sp. NU459]